MIDIGKNLDSDISELRQKLDPRDILGKALALDSQIEETIKLAEDWKIPKIEAGNVIILGMGGSAIGGDFIRAYGESRCRVPITVCRDYKVPVYVGSDTLCIASSYSGNTEETLSALSDCRQRGAKIMSVSTGGRMQEMAREHGFPHYLIPGGLEPRSALGYSFSALYILMTGTGLMEGKADDLLPGAKIIRKHAEEWPPGQGIPMNLARKLHGHIPVIYGAPGWLSVMAYRWKCQFNENSKVFSAWATYPEMNHNEIVGWDAPGELLKKIQVINLRDIEDHFRVSHRVDLTGQRIVKKVPVTDIWTRGRTDMEKIFYMIFMGDLITIYLAYLNGQDPGVIESINWLKEELSRI